MEIIILFSQAFGLKSVAGKCSAEIAILQPDYANLGGENAGSEAI